MRSIIGRMEVSRFMSLSQTLGDVYASLCKKGASGTCQQLWDTRELHLVSLDYGGETREVGAIDVNIDQDLRCVKQKKEVPQVWTPPREGLVRHRGGSFFPAAG